MDSSYTELNELPYDLPALHAFLDGIDLTPAKHAQLLGLLEAVNLRSSLSAVRYCTKMLKEKQIMDDTEAYYEAILARATLENIYSKNNPYLFLYSCARKLLLASIKLSKTAAVSLATKALEANIRLWFSIRQYSAR